MESSHGNTTIENKTQVSLMNMNKMLKSPDFSEQSKKNILEEIDDELFDRLIQARFFNATLGDFKIIPKDLVTSERGFFITGPRGIGKTHLLSAIAREIVMGLSLSKWGHGDTLSYSAPARSAYPRIVNVPRLLLNIRDSFRSDSEESELGIIKDICRPQVLLFDDIGSEKSSEWVIQTLFLIIDHRYENMSKTYFSSNLNLKQLSAHCGSRIASRIAGMTRTLRMEGRDRRLAI